MKCDHPDLYYLVEARTKYPPHDGYEHPVQEVTAAHLGGEGPDGDLGYHRHHGKQESGRKEHF